MTAFNEVSFISVPGRSTDVDNNFGGVELPTYEEPDSNMGRSSNLHRSSPGLNAASNTEERKASEHDAYEGEPGESSVYGASFNFINSIVGAGIIAIPSAVQQCGLILGVLLLLLVAYLVKCSVLMLIDCGIHAGKYDLEELAEHLLGRRGYYFTLVFMFLFGYGAQIAYLVVLGDTIPRAAQLLTPETFFCSRFNTLLLLGTVCVLPLSSVRKLSTLAWSSMISVAGVVVVILIVLIACATLSSHHQDERFEVADIDNVNDSLFAGVGTMAFAFVCQHNSFMVFRSLAKPTAKEWRRVADLSLGFAWSVCTAFGLIGFFTFYPYVEGDLLNNFPVNSVAIACARLFLAFTMILTYPMECYVTRHCVLSILTKLYDDRREARGFTDPAPDTSSIMYKIDSALAAVTDAVIMYATTTANRTISYVTGADPSHNNSATMDVISPTRRHENSTYTSVVGSTDNNIPNNNTIADVTNPIFANNNNHSSEGDTLVTSTLNTHQVTEETCSSNHISDGSTYHHTNTTIDHNTNPMNNNHHTSTTNTITNTSHYANYANDTSLPATDRASSAAHIGLTLLLWSSSLCIALVFEELGVVASLTGAVAASMLGFVLPATLFLKTHEVAVREAYNQSKYAYYGIHPTTSNPTISSGIPNTIESSHSATAVPSTPLHSTFHREDSVVNPINLWPSDHESNPLHTDEEVVTVTFAAIDDVTDGEVNMLPTGIHTTQPTQPTYVVCNAIVNTTLYRMVIPFRSFWLPFFMIFFGFVSLIVGVMTVFRDSSS